VSTTQSFVGLVAVIGAIFGGQAFWIGRALDQLSARIDRLETRLEALLERLDRQG